VNDDPVLTRKDGASRRQFLKGVGGFTLAIPLLPSLLPKEAFAQGMPNRKRFAQMCTNHGGLWHSNMFPAASMLTEQMAYKGRTARRGDLRLSAQGSRVGVSPIVSAPADRLTPALLAKMNIVAGLDIPFYIAHNTGAHLGNYARNDGNGRDGMMVQSQPRPTIDQIMAWSPEFYATPVRQRVMIVGNRYSYYWSNPATRTGTIQQIDGTRDSLELFDQVFGPITPGPMRRPIVDRVLENYRRLRNGSSRLSTGDRRRLDEHMQGLSELERRLTATVSCGALTRPTQGSISLLRTSDYGLVPERQAQAHALYNDVIALAFACGASRLAVVAVEDTYSTFSGDWHQDIAHKSHLPGMTEQMTIAAAHQYFFANTFLDLARKLDALTDIDGTVLDNTLLVWSQESGNMTHENQSMPLVTFGSGGGGLRTGSFVDYRDTSREMGERYQGTPEPRYTGLIWNQWLANALQVMGIPAAQWEEPGGGFGVPFVGTDYRSFYPAAALTGYSDRLPYLRP
jgi:hypothetical protein